MMAAGRGSRGHGLPGLRRFANCSIAKAWRVTANGRRSPSVLDCFLVLSSCAEPLVTFLIGYLIYNQLHGATSFTVGQTSSIVLTTSSGKGPASTASKFSLNCSTLLAPRMAASPCSLDSGE